MKNQQNNHSLKKGSNILIVSLFVLAVGALIAAMFMNTDDPIAFFSSARWFDPAFFQYNFLMLLTSVFLTPIITIVYTQRMQSEKSRRIRRNLSEEEWETHKDYIEERLANASSFRNYAGSLAIVTVVILFGASIMLIMKPVPFSAPSSDLSQGVDFARGANFLMSGPYMFDYVSNDPVYIERVMESLAAFQFGFLGAYIYFLTHLVRSYFTLDLTPDIFVSSSVRMIMGSVLSLVLAFAVVEIGEDGAFVQLAGLEVFSIGWLPFLSFMIGFFPDRALMWMSKRLSSAFGLMEREYKNLDLRFMSGMAHGHELRLRREGYDNVENLAHANCLDLAVRTGFGYRQLESWIGEAKLRFHFREDFDQFRKKTGIVDMSDLARFVAQSKSSGQPLGVEGWEKILGDPSKTSDGLSIKASIACELLLD